MSEVDEQGARYQASDLKRFGYTYIVCATGRTAEEMLALARGRLANDRSEEHTSELQSQR